MKKTIKIILILLIITSFIIPIGRAIATEENNVKVILESGDKLEAGKEITVAIKISEITQNIDTVIGVLEYDKDIFEEIIEDDMTPQGKWQYPTYNSADGIFIIERKDSTNVEETIMKIRLKVKDGVTATNTKITLSDIEIAGLGKDLITEKEVNVTIGEITNPDIPEEPEEKLYLSTEVYKIGNKDIKNYENGDKYISRVEKETTKEEFIENLKTNGTIRIIKQDGKELGSNELVGTGMTIEVTKEKEKIELQIAVMGDLDGNGKITATDLSTLNQTILKTVTLENEYKIAGDLDENDKITATDLSTLNKMLLKIL